MSVGIDQKPYPSGSEPSRSRITPPRQSQPYSSKRKRSGNDIAIFEPLQKRNSNWLVKGMKGECAPFNDRSCWIHDSFHRKMYMIGGTRPTDETNSPTSDFYCYHTDTMKWENLTNTVLHHNPFDPYSSTTLKRKKRPLPPIGDPGCTLWRLGDTSFIFMFGGYDDVEECATSQVIIINLEQLQWWYQPFEGNRNGAPRISPAIVAIENRVYIFGGYRAYEGDPQACYSYSIAEWRPAVNCNAQSRWYWDVQDVPYHGPIPGNSVVGQAISVFGGKKIFLTPGRLNSSDTRVLNFTAHNLFCFRPADRLFQKVELLGDFPRSIGYYYAFDFRKTMQPSTPMPSANLTSTKKPGRPRKYALPPIPVVPQLSQNPAGTSNYNASSVLLCAWIPHPIRPLTEEDPDLIPQLYHLNLDPSCEEIKSLDISTKIVDDDNYSFEGFSFVGESMHLLGNKNDTSDTDSESETETDPTWNVYIDVPFGSLGMNPQ